MGLPQEVTAEAELGEQLDLADSAISRAMWLAVLVAALGYFVDVFDMWLFANFRVASLTALGLSGPALTDTGAFIINCQQTGFLLGGVVWGLMGDRRGRVSVMFGSILLYSAGTLLSAYVTTVGQYAILRFVTGFGLAGEIGAGITLISELLPAAKRGLGTTVVTGLGVAGAIGAAAAGKWMSWQHAYMLGGAMGFLLLALRVAISESGMYAHMLSDETVRRGSLKLLFATGSRIRRLFCCLMVGVPIYIVFGVFATFAPEIASALGISESVAVPDIMLFTSIGITIGDVASGLLSHYFRSRKGPILAFQMIAFALAVLLGGGFIHGSTGYMLVAGALGICTGYWACLITAVAEQFGTNLRATVTTMVPNLVRSSTIVLNIGFIQFKTFTDPATAALWLTFIVFVPAILSLLALRETFGEDLKYFER
ncbi:MAG: MFS transporter [Bdellovibrionota bacterium]